MKIVIVTLLALTLASAQFLPQLGDVKDNEQQFLNGYYEGIGLSDPQTIMVCVDATTAQQISTFAHDILNEGCNLNGNQEVAQLQKKLGPIDEIKIIAYIGAHFIPVKKSVCGIKDDWYGSRFKQAGSDAMVLTKQILGLKVNEDLAVDSYLAFTTPADDEQQFLNGFFEGIGLPDPTTIMACVDATTAQDISTFAHSILKKACELSLINIQSIIDEVKKFIDSLNPDVKTCLDGNDEVTALTTKLGPIDTAKVLAYVTSHFFAVRKSVCYIKDDWYGSNFKKAGTDTMVLVKQILGLKLEQSEIQSIYLLTVDDYLIYREENITN